MGKRFLMKMSKFEMGLYLLNWPSIISQAIAIRIAASSWCALMSHLSFVFSFPTGNTNEFGPKSIIIVERFPPPKILPWGFSHDWWLIKASSLTKAFVVRHLRNAVCHFHAVSANYFHLHVACHFCFRPVGNGNLNFPSMTWYQTPSKGTFGWLTGTSHIWNSCNRIYRKI